MPHELSSLQRYTSARVGLGRCGTGLPTSAVLDFRLAHAQARDAVLVPANLEQIVNDLAVLGMASILLESQAPDRSTYVARPDLGRRLDQGSLDQLHAIAQQENYSAQPPDLAVVICDGLSGHAVESWAVELLRHFRTIAHAKNWTIAPVAVVRNGRVALGDSVGEALHARLTLLLIGERPGLGSADSLGVYLTYAPRTGTTDEARNCISNIRATGLPPAAAAHKMGWLVNEALARCITGTTLKDEAPLYTETIAGPRSALTAQP